MTLMVLWFTKLHFVVPSPSAGLRLSGGKIRFAPRSLTMLVFLFVERRLNRLAVENYGLLTRD